MYRERERDIDHNCQRSQRYQHQCVSSVLSGGIIIVAIISIISVSYPAVRLCREVGGIRLETSSGLLGFKPTYHRPHFIGTCVKHRGLRFHQIRDFKQYYFNSVPPTSHLGKCRARALPCLAAARLCRPAPLRLLLVWSWLDRPVGTTIFCQELFPSVRIP